MDQQPPQRIGMIKWTLRIALWLCGLAIVVFILFFVIGMLANRAGRIPDQLRADPAELVKLIPPAATTTTTAIPLTPNSANADLIMSAELTRNDWFYRWSQDGLFRHNTPVTAKEAEWLQKLAPTVKALHRLAQSRPQTEEQFASVVQARRYPWSFLLVQDARYQAQQGHYDAAHDDLIDMLELWRWRCPEPEFYMGMFDNMCAIMLHCIADPAWPADRWAGIPERLEAIDKSLLDPAAIRSAMIRFHLRQRRELVEQLDRPWHRHPYFNPIIGPNDYWSKRLDIPNGFTLLLAASDAIAKKTSSAEELKKFDRDFATMLDMASMTYPDQVAKYGITPLKPEIDEKSILYPQYRYWLGDMVAGRETPIHLARVGVMWRIDPERTRAMRTEDLHGKPHHPWRDPYTEKPFNIDETSTCTTITSLGPNLHPAWGRQSYNGHVTLPRR